jgi:hypothetical protein
MDRASIYLTMDNYPENKLVIRKAKEWATDTNPAGLAWTYNIINGCQFVNIQKSEPEIKPQRQSTWVKDK